MMTMVTMIAMMTRHNVFTTYETLRHQQQTNPLFNYNDHSAMLHHNLHLTRLSRLGQSYLPTAVVISCPAPIHAALTSNTVRTPHDQ